MISRKRTIVIFLAILVVFIGLHVSGLHISYQQDEMKWTYYAKYELNPPGTIPHPPLTELLYARVGPLVGDDNYRLIPFAFGLINLFLVFYLAKLIFNTRTALWTAFLFTVSYYSLLSSLMVDVDGAFMPMFFLIMAIGYFKLRAKSFELREGGWKWLVLLVIGAIGGFLVKVSGILPLGAVALDFAIERGAFNDKKKVIKYTLWGLVALLAVFALIYLSKFVFTYFNIDKSLKYWEHFANSSSFWGRGWFQTFIQLGKSILYTSPLLVVPALFADKEIWRKTRLFFFFVFIGIIFYFFVFDFSIGALDRYLQFMVIPFCIISAAVFSKYLWKDENDKKEIKHEMLRPILGAAIIFFLQFIPHSIPPLYPKGEWLSKMLSFEWNFLFPFMGGSGPLPFYVSFLFIALIWLVCVLLFLYYWKRPQMKQYALLGILVFGLIYNAVFTEEYLFGRINGNTQTLLTSAVAFIKSNDDIKEVMVYNDTGGFEIRQSGKFKIRIYATPWFEEGYKAEFANYDGNILFIDIPRVSDDSLYKKYFDSCKVLYSESNKQISSKIYDCSI